MCGIAGLVGIENQPPDRIQVERMVAALKHRGPDAQTVHIDGPVGFGHARLSIIDLAGGQQPLFNEDRSVAVICNGEIYNYRELRDGLLQRGHQFRTHSDCEVLAHLWEESGRAMLDSLRGMFALVLYDRRQGIVFGARDRFGQKPLFYTANARRFAFASEVKSLLTLPDVCRDLDLTALDQYLFSSFVPSPRTMFAGIQRLPAGHWFELKISAESRQSPEKPGRHHPPESAVHVGSYWQPAFRVEDRLSSDEHLARVDSALSDAVSSHLVADVPVGVFLSGGIDSSLVTALAARHSGRRLQTFSLTFPGSRQDEGPLARQVSAALGTEHHEFPFQANDLPGLLTSAAALFDQPLADTAALPLMLLSRQTARHVKVVLTGDGGDELFAGYRKYQRMTRFPGRSRWFTDVMTTLCPPHFLSLCAADPLGTRKLRSRLVQALAPATRSAYRRQGWEGWERFALYQADVHEACAANDAASRAEPPHGLRGRETPLNAALRLDQGTTLADRLLLKGDYATMAAGLEARAPLLDHHLAAVAGALPDALKATPGETKIALRALARRHLPAEVTSARKKGFTMPLDQWLRTDLREFTHAHLLDGSATLPRLFQRRPIEQLLTAHHAGANHAQRIYTLLMFELWYREYAC